MARSPRDCRFIELSSDRRLAYTEWGDPQGTPVLYCHGFPGSRLEARLGDAAAMRLGIRLIAPDRPGFGASTLLPDRRLSDWPRDLIALADALQLDRFDILGVSGGGPYAIACGERAGNRVRHLAIVCGLGELATDDGTGGMNPAVAGAIRFYQEVPLLAHWAYARVIGPLLGRYPALILRILTGVADAADREVLADPVVRRTITDSFSEAFRAGGEGPAQELALFTRTWDVDLTKVVPPVHLWHGEADRTVPVAMGRRLAARLPRCTAHFIPGEGHFSLIVRYMEPILGRLIEPLH